MWQLRFVKHFFGVTQRGSLKLDAAWNFFFLSSYNNFVFPFGLFTLEPRVKEDYAQGFFLTRTAFCGWWRLCSKTPLLSAKIKNPPGSPLLLHFVFKVYIQRANVTQSFKIYSWNAFFFLEFPERDSPTLMRSIVCFHRKTTQTALWWLLGVS